ncbi:unnamed protein product [Chrysoparadoxa australica]
MDPLFVIEAATHGKGPVLFNWDAKGEILASTGANTTVNIWSCKGKLIARLQPPGNNACTALEWDPTGQVLAIAQANASAVLLWYKATNRVRTIELRVKEVTLVRWSHTGEYIALGTSKGRVCIYYRRTHEKHWAAGRHKRRIVCGAWSSFDKLAYASEDRQISISSVKDGVFDQVKVKCKPVEVAFGGKSDQNEEIVSVNMERRTILLYNMSEQDNALELAFQARYGSIVSYRWFGDGYIMAGFSSGFVVVISTHFHEIGREQYCAKFHENDLRDIALCNASKKLATCGDNCVKLIDMEDWKCWGANSIRAPDLQEIKTFPVEKEGRLLHRLGWSENGHLLSVSSSNGSIYTFVVRAGSQDVAHLYPNSTSAKLLTPIPVWLALLLSIAAVIGRQAGSSLSHACNSCKPFALHGGLWAAIPPLPSHQPQALMAFSAKFLPLLPSFLCVSVGADP